LTTFGFNSQMMQGKPTGCDRDGEDAGQQYARQQVNHTQRVAPIAK
jgi:hypothetical protein